MPKKAETETPDPLVEVDYNGHTFTFPREQEEWPTKAILAASRRQYDAVVEHVLGPEQWDRLLTVAAPAYKQFMEFLSLFADTVATECNQS